MDDDLRGLVQVLKDFIVDPISCLQNKSVSDQLVKVICLVCLRDIIFAFLWKDILALRGLKDRLWDELNQPGFFLVIWSKNFFGQKFLVNSDWFFNKLRFFEHDWLEDVNQLFKIFNEFLKKREICQWRIKALTICYWDLSNWKCSFALRMSTLWVDKSWILYLYDYYIINYLI